MEEKFNNAKKIKNDTKMYEELLLSDDDFPLEYNEVPSTPAYKIDSRFDMIEFKWIKDPNIYNFNVTPKPISSTESSYSGTSSLSELNFNGTSGSSIDDKAVNTPIIQGILSEYDLYCIKSIEGLTEDATFLWFIKFLMYKDIQSRYRFLKSCLVSDNLYNVKYNVKLSNNTKQNMYKIVIKL